MNILDHLKISPLSVLIATSLISSPVLASNNFQTIALQQHSSFQQADISQTNTVERIELFKVSNIKNSKGINLAASSCEQSRNENRRCETLEKF